MGVRTREFATPPTLLVSEVCLWPLSFNIGVGMQGLGVRKPRVIALMAGRPIREFMASSSHPLGPSSVSLSTCLGGFPCGRSNRCRETLLISIRNATVSSSSTPLHCDFFGYRARESRFIWAMSRFRQVEFNEVV